MAQLILGSSSPRRKELLEIFNMPFLQIPPGIDESLLPLHPSPEVYALSIAQAKSNALKLLYPNSPIITADTIVVHEKEVLGKPKDYKENCTMLKRLQGTWHTVYTAIVTVHGPKSAETVAETRVLMHPLTDAQIDTYLAACLNLDKAGGYAIQGIGSLVISRIEGCFYNAMGLPIIPLEGCLNAIGISLWNYLPPPPQC